MKKFEIASYGVTMFFSLSGFLITYLLLTEKKRFDTIDIKKFYIRRLLRIWPLYYLYLLITMAVIAYFDKELLTQDVGWYFFLAANVPFIMGTAFPELSHYWSLGVEEQFYLFWPLVILYAKKPIQTVSIFLVVFLLLKIFSRLWFWKTGNSLPLMALQVTRFDCMALGGLGACLYFQKQPLFMKLATSRTAQVLVLGVIAMILFNYFHVASLFDHEIVAAFVVVLIINISSNPSTLVRLDYPVFDFLGRISYGIYVIHPLIILLMGKFIGFTLTGLNQGVAITLITLCVVSVTLLLAWLSYELFEKRFLRLKQAFAKVVSTS